MYSLSFLTTLFIGNVLLWTVINYFMTHQRVFDYYYRTMYTGSIKAMFGVWRCLLGFALLSLTALYVALGNIVTTVLGIILLLVAITVVIVKYVPYYLEKGEEYVATLLESAEVDKD